MNKSEIVRDEENNIYLKLTGKPLEIPAYFRIEDFTTKPKGKIINLSLGLLFINLK
jgi:hypothetical protein